MRGLCPNETNNCIRKYRRNLINMNETLSYHMSWYMIIFLEHMSVLCFSKLDLDPKIVFFTHNIIVFILYFTQHLFLINHFQLSYTELLSKKKAVLKHSFFGSNQQILKPRRPTAEVSATSSLFVCSLSCLCQSHHLAISHSPNSPTVRLHGSSQDKRRAHSPPPPFSRPGIYIYAGLKQFSSSANSPKPNSKATCSPRRGLYSYLGLGQRYYAAHPPANSPGFPFNGPSSLDPGTGMFSDNGLEQTRGILPLELQGKSKSTMPDVR